MKTDRDITKLVAMYRFTDDWFNISYLMLKPIAVYYVFRIAYIQDPTPINMAFLIIVGLVAAWIVAHIPYRKLWEDDKR